MAVGFAAAAVGDELLVFRSASRSSLGFLLGVAAFAAAQLLWTAGQRREARPDWRVFCAAALPLALFAGVRLRGVLPAPTWVAVCVYCLVTAFSLSVGVSAGRVFYVSGLALLCASDVMIGGRLIGVPGCSSLSGPLYALAECCMVVSFFAGDREKRWRHFPEQPAFCGALLFGAAAFTAFALAALSWPGGGYNPFMRMLSALGRTSVHGVDWPWCHYLFVVGMVFASCAVMATFGGCPKSLGGWRGRAAGWGLAANVGGLLAIALVPENVDQLFHNVGCWSATLGGAAILLARLRGRRDAAWTAVLASITVAFGLAVALHAWKRTPYAPWVPSMQKAVIAAFALWALDCARRDGRRRVGWRAGVALAVMVALVALRGALALTGAPSLKGSDGAGSLDATPQLPFSEDERAALKWLDYVTGPLPAAEEREWWEVGGTQHGLFAKRYHIAFCGYAAAALGWRGGEGERAVAGRILRRCVERILKTDVWSYSMSKSYWGRKPWAPDPCYRENVMYTGHLLHLLALYEAFTGDTRYWTEGWDFVWKDGRRVHYDVQKLLDVTLHQMRSGPCGGVSCEPGLVFFPCNNHPHVAMALFSALGHGDWTEDARRWESWALSHYSHPLWGGGALSLVYHLRSGVLYPRGHNALDGWSLLWFEPWASDRAAALALWRDAAAGIDWDEVEHGTDELRPFDACRNPADVPPVVTAAFLAAAARACDDVAVAQRLEKVADRSLVRRDGMLWLETPREWRVGVSAMRIVALAEAGGLRFRSAIRGRSRPQ